MPKKSPEGDPTPRKKNDVGRRDVHATTEANTPFSKVDFLKRYYQEHVGFYKTTEKIDKEFAADRWAAHLLVASVPEGAAEGAITGAQYFDETIANLAREGKPTDEALSLAFTMTASALNIEERPVQIWYITRDYDFAAAGLEHPGEWIRHERR